jgi:hypothetical protein
VSWGLLLVVALAFFLLGFGLASFLLKKKSSQESTLNLIEEKVLSSSDRISKILDRVNGLLSEFKETKLNELKRELLSLEEELKRLKEDASGLHLSEGSIDALHRAEELLKELNFSLPSIDNSLLMQVKDNLLIIRNDVQNILSSTKEAPNLDFTNLSVPIDRALELAREVNKALVRSELLSLIVSLRDESRKELVKELDKLALDSRELVSTLEVAKKELEGAGK